MASTERDLSKTPYSADEARVVAYLVERGVGGGEDPIGFLLASYSHAIDERNDLLGRRKNDAPAAAPQEVKMAKFKVTVEYDLTHFIQAGDTVEQVAAIEERDWRERYLPDILAYDFITKVSFEVVP